MAMLIALVYSFDKDIFDSNDRDGIKKEVSGPTITSARPWGGSSDDIAHRATSPHGQGAHWRLRKQYENCLFRSA